MTRQQQRQQVLDQARQLMEQFDRLFPKDEDAFEQLCALVGQSAFSCHHCRKPLVPNEGERTSDCHHCKQTSWRSSGSFFENVRKPRAWLAAIWLLGNGMMVGSPALANLIKTSQSTALVIVKKLAIVINNCMSEESADVDSFNFAGLICRRSILTPAEKHPLSEEIQIQEQAKSATAAAAQRQQETLQKAAELGDSALRVYELLSSKPIFVDDLIKASKLNVAEVMAALTMLQLEGIVTALPGNNYLCGKPPRIFKDGTRLPDCTDRLPENIMHTIEAIRQFVAIRSDGSSRKYLQLCLAVFWCCHDDLRWGFRQLLRACGQSPPITYQDVLLFASPAPLKLGAAAP
ncbi:MAG TPA: hypothetical protein V6D22_00015 [Candidatus Obscuribacterales bacterium]